MEFILAPFNLAPFTYVQYTNDKHVEKINQMVVIKRIKISLLG